jgi:hypothetical protein
MHQNKPLKNKFEHFSVEPRPEVWQRIEAELNEKSKHRFANWWRYIAAILLIGVGTAFYLKYKSSLIKNQVASKEQSKLRLHAEDIQTQSGMMANDETDSVKMNRIHGGTLVQSQTSQNAISSPIKKSAPISVVSSPKNFPKTKNLSGSIDAFTTSSNNYEPLGIAEDFKAKPEASPNQLDTVQQENGGELQNPTVVMVDSSAEKDFNDHKKNSKWSLNLNAGIYGTAVDKVYYANQLFTDLSLGIPNPNNEAFQSNSLVYYRNVVQGVGAELGYRILPKWQLKLGVNLLIYRTNFISEGFVQRGANYFQWAFGGDYNLLQIERFHWQIGTGIGTGILRNPVVGGTENHWRSEWNINTSLGFSILPKIAIRIQPTSRLIVADTQVGGFGKLTKWYHGVNLGITFNP